MAFLTPSPLANKNHTRHPTHTIRRPRLRACLSNHSIDTLLATLRKNPPRPAPTNRVHLIGVGPGDPAMLTLSALYHMRTAEIILYDRLITPQILSLLNPSAQLIYVGKSSGLHTRTQDDIHLLLSFFASSGKKLIRLKGGDPLIFGRGGEEISHLASHGVDAVSIPGVTAAAGIAADLGIPLTMRGYAHAVKFLTGHAREGSVTDIGTVDQGTTYVIYMGLGMLPGLVNAFVEKGMPRDMPAAAVERGTTTAQRTVVGTLDQLCERVSRADLKSPTLIFLGEVVSFSRVWGAEHVVEGVREGAFVEDDVFGPVLENAVELVDRMPEMFAA